MLYGVTGCLANHMTVTPPTKNLLLSNPYSRTCRGSVFSAPYSSTGSLLRSPYLISTGQHLLNPLLRMDSILFDPKLSLHKRYCVNYSGQS